jgi:hypothetical protein
MSRISGDLVVAGALQAGSFNAPSNSIGDASVDAARPLGATKTIKQLVQIHATDSGVVVASAKFPIHLAYGNGTILAFDIALGTANGVTTTITADLLKNGVSVLTGVVTLPASGTNFATIVGSISTAAYVANDFFEVNITLAGANPGKGLVCRAIFRENPS